MARREVTLQELWDRGEVLAPSEQYKVKSGWLAPPMKGAQHDLGVAMAYKAEAMEDKAHSFKVLARECLQKGGARTVDDQNLRYYVKKMEEISAELAQVIEKFLAQ